MTSRNINLFSLFSYGCIALLFNRNVYSYPQKEFVFPNLKESKIETATASVSIEEDESPISNTNYMNGNSNLRSHSSHDISTLYNETYNNGELFNLNAWPENGTRIEQRQLPLQLQNNVSTTVGIDTIVFPTEVAQLQPNEPQHATNKPQGSGLDCKHSTFCENVPYYPEEIINNIIQQNDSIKYLANVDVLPEITQRLNVNEESLCKSNYQILYPKMGKSKEKGWVTIVNQENLKQGVVIETCDNENSECSIAGSLSGGYRTSCVQKYIDRKLVALTDNNEVAQEIFPIPISCCCHQKFTGNAVERFGISVKQGSQTTPVKDPKKNLFNSVQIKSTTLPYYGELEFPKRFENSESNKNEAVQTEITATATSASIENHQLPISNANHMNGNINLKNYTFQDIPTYFDETYKNRKLFSPNNTWLKNDNDSDSERNQSTQNDKVQYHVLYNGNEYLISLIKTDIQVKDTLDSVSPSVDKSIGCFLHGTVSPKFYFISPISSFLPNSYYCGNKFYYSKDSTRGNVSHITHLQAPDVIYNTQYGLNFDRKPRCEIYRRKIVPQLVFNENKKFSKVENRENSNQGFSIYICVNENSECSIADNMPEGYKTSCVQRFIDRKIITVTKSNETAEKIFPIPISCCCRFVLAGILK